MCGPVECSEGAAHFATERHGGGESRRQNFRIARPAAAFVPGHGPAGSVEDIPPLRHYLEGLLDGTATAVEGWGFAEVHERNVEALRP